MSTEYIVKFSKNVGNCLFPSEKVDGFVELNPSNNNFTVPTIRVRTHKEQNHESNIDLLFKFITSNFATVDFDDDNKSCSLKYKDGYSRSLEYNSVIEFDDSSSSAYSEFKKSFESLLNSKKETEYYDSGRIKYIGDWIEKDVAPMAKEDVYNGEGVLYFDSHYNRVKYAGEFEDGEFDGAGKFYNSDNNVTLIANNISNGIPVQKGHLHVNFKHRQQVLEIVFNELWVKLDVDDKESKRQLVKSNDFVNIVTSAYLEKSSRNINKLLFEDKNSSEQNVELWNNINDLRLEIVKSRNDMNINMNNLVSVGKAFSSVLILNLMLNMVVIFMH